MQDLSSKFKTGSTRKASIRLEGGPCSFFSASASASADPWFSKVKEEFSETPIPQINKSTLQAETYEEMYKRLTALEKEIKMEVNTAAADSKSQDGILKNEQSRIRLFVKIVANGYDKFDLLYPQLRPKDINMSIPKESRITTLGCSDDSSSKQDRFILVAAMHGQVEFLRKLLIYGANPDVAGIGVVPQYPEPSIDFSYSPLMIAMPLPHLKQESGAGKTALILAAEHGHVGCLQVLLEDSRAKNRVDINYLPKERTATTALHAAAKYGHSECVRYLLGKNAATDIKDCNKEIPLQVAIDTESSDLIKEKMNDRRESLSSTCCVS